MCTRKVTVQVYSYPEDFHKTLPYYRLMQILQVLEFTDKFLSDKSLEDILRDYIDNTGVYASFIDETRWYRIIVRDSDSRVSHIFKA